MHIMELGPKAVHTLLPFSSLDSYTTPTKRQEEERFLNHEHIESLKEESCITDWETLGEEYIDGTGTLRRIGFVTEQGYAYAALVGIPDLPQSQVPIIGTSAWFTSVEGHNEHTVRNLIRNGNYVCFVGAEGSFEPAKEVKIQPKSEISLAGSAAAVLNFSYHAVDELVLQGHRVDTQERILIGESRGAMVGMGIAALAEEFGQTIILSDLTAPCLPRRFSLPDIQHLVGQVASEPKELLRLMGKMTLGRGIHYPATFDPSPYSLKHQFAIGFALFSGEAGMLARHIAHNTLMHITTFDNDFASMTEEWKQIFKNYPNVRITPLPGSHLTIADLETLHYILARNYAAQCSLNSGLSLTQETVFDAAHKFISLQQVVASAA